MKFVRLLFAFLLVFSAAAQKSVTYDSTTKQAYPTNLWFLNPSTPTAPTAGTNIVNKDYVDSVAGGVSPFSYNASLSSGTNAYFNPGKIVFTDQTVLDFPGGSITCIDGRTNYVGINRFSGNLHALKAGLDMGTIFFAQVVCSGGSITSVEQGPIVLPTDRLSRFKHAIQNTNHQQTLVRIGNSIMRGTYGATNRWMDQIFLSTATLTNALLPNLSYLTSVHFDYGGQKSSDAATWVGQGTSAITFSTNHSANMIFGSDFASSFPTYGAKVYKTQAGQAPNLAVITDYFNGGRENWLLLANTVKQLRRQGCEVILTSDNEPRDTPTTIYENYQQWQAICDAYGAHFADTRSYLEEADAKGENVYYDINHPNWRGAQLYTECVRAAFSGNTESGSAPPQLGNRIVAFDNPEYWTTNGVYPQFVDFQLATYTTGTYVPTAIPAGDEYVDVIPSVLLAGKTTNDCVLALEPGQEAWFGHPFAKSAKIVIERSLTRFAYNWVNLWGDDLVANPIYPASDVPSLSTTELVTGLYTSTTGPSNVWLDPTAFENGLSPFRNIAFKVVGATNTSRIIGVIWDTVPWVEVPRASWKYSGIWTYDSFQGLPLMPVSDVVGSAFEFDFTGTGCIILLAVQQSAGRVDVWMDGQQIYDNHQLLETTGGPFTHTLKVMPGNAAWSQANSYYGKHTVRVELALVSNAASAPSAGYRPLMPLAAYALDTR